MPGAAIASIARMIALRVNGEHRELEVEPRRTLVEALRLDLGLTGAKEACGMGNCGAYQHIVQAARLARER